MQRLAAEHPDLTVVSLDPLICPCSTMFRVDAAHLAWVLENLVEGTGRQPDQGRRRHRRQRTSGPGTDARHRLSAAPRPPRVAVVSLDRAMGMGEAQRVASWVAIFEAVGSRGVDHLPPPRPPHPAPVGRGGGGDGGRRPRDPGLVGGGRWTATLARLEADVVVCVTARAFHPSLVDGRRTVVVDFVDRLSVSYRDRAGITGPWSRRLLFHGLAATSGRFERRPPGRRGADRGRRLGRRPPPGAREWVPIVVEPPAARPIRGAPDCDVLFFGNLAYPPNVAAVERLARLWPAILARRPGTTARIAGANATPGVRTLAAGHGWDVVSDFPDVGDLCAGARLAVVPLDHTAGIQIKVLEAAALGLAQVVTPASIRGMRPGFPVTVAATDDEMVTAIVELLDDPARRDREGGGRPPTTWPSTTRRRRGRAGPRPCPRPIRSGR